MPRITPSLEDNPGAGRGCMTCLFGLFGMLFPGVNMIILLADDRNTSWPKYVAVGVCALLALIIVGWTIARLVQNSLWGRFDASIIESVVRRGDEFHFHIEQFLRHRARVKRVRVFLIYRETIEMQRVDSDHRYTEVHKFDRLIDRSEQPGGDFNPGEVLEGTHRLRIPTRMLFARHPFQWLFARHPSRYLGPGSHTAGWVVKVRVDLTGGRVDWREFQLRSDFDPGQSTTGLPTELTDDMFDLLCTEVPWFQRPGTGRVWNSAVPHGLWGSKVVLPPVPSFLVLERRSRTELEEVKAKLERVGAVLEIRPSR
ncbi:MAG: hypothetical protein EOP06_14780 [Proteobacteria bacterium]|nr:MAG: hypothetical protein EOP06_14780 [Pseudomonadota bacterium]